MFSLFKVSFSFANCTRLLGPWITVFMLAHIVVDYLTKYYDMLSRLSIPYKGVYIIDFGVWIAYYLCYKMPTE